MTFHQPSAWFLVLLALLPLLWWRWSAPSRRGAIAFSAVEPLRRAGVSWAVRLRWIVPALRTAALALLIVCLARPQKANERTRIYSESVAIQLVVDRSASMLAEDFELERRPVSRLTAVKKVVEDFIGGGENLPGRPDDVIGLVSFATFADAACPPTLDHDHLVRTVRETEVSPLEEDRNTALGDAIALGVERLQGLDRRRDLFKDDPIKSKIMIVLADGEENASEIDPITAANLAVTYGIKVYTIGAGTKNAFAPIPDLDPRTGRTIIRRAPASIDEAMLRRIADMTGGKYFRATDSASLESIYAEIDALERTEVEQRRYMEYRELALTGARLGGVRIPPLLAVVFGLLALEILLSHTRFRTLPDVGFTMDIRFEQLESLHWLWAAALLLALVVVSFQLRRRALARFASAHLHERLLGGAGSGRRIVRSVLLLAALPALVAAMIDPRWGVTFQRVQQRGVDIVFVVDVSRSMLAEDARPNRLERAKQFIRDLVAELGGDRVALVTFAGAAATKCPLTVDYSAFGLALDLVGPESTARGGSLLGDGIRLAGDAFTDELPDHKVVIVLTDGEDHGSYPLEAAQRLREQHDVPVFTVGIGDAETGARIPVEVAGQRVYQTYRGQEVWTKMDASGLRDIALATGGAYLPVGTGTMDLARIYEERIAPMARRELDAAELKRRNPQYQWFAGLALGLLLVESFLGNRAPRRRTATAGAWSAAPTEAVA